MTVTALLPLDVHACLSGFPHCTSGQGSSAKTQAIKMKSFSQCWRFYSFLAVSAFSVIGNFILSIFFNPHPRICLFFSREGKVERERNIGRSPLAHAGTRAHTRSLGACPAGIEPTAARRGEPMRQPRPLGGAWCGLSCFTFPAARGRCGGSSASEPSAGTRAQPPPAPSRPHPVQVAFCLVHAEGCPGALLAKTSESGDRSPTQKGCPGTRVGRQFRRPGPARADPWAARWPSAGRLALTATATATGHMPPLSELSEYG